MMARSKDKTWHGFVGPLGAYIPDSPRDMVYSAAASLGALVGTRIALNLATRMEVARMAAHHLPTTYVRGQVVSAAVRRQASRQVGKWTVGRGLALIATSSPIGMAITAAVFLSSMPPDVTDSVTGMTSYEVYLAGDVAKGN